MSLHSKTRLTAPHPSRASRIREAGTFTTATGLRGRRIIAPDTTRLDSDGFVVERTTEVLEGAPFILSASAPRSLANSWQHTSVHHNDRHYGGTRRARSRSVDTEDTRSGGAGHYQRHQSDCRDTPEINYGVFCTDEVEDADDISILDVDEEQEPYVSEADAESSPGPPKGNRFADAAFSYAFADVSTTTCSTASDRSTPSKLRDNPPAPGEPPSRGPVFYASRVQPRPQTDGRRDYESTEDVDEGHLYQARKTHFCAQASAVLRARGSTSGASPSLASSAPSDAWAHPSVDAVIDGLMEQDDSPDANKKFSGKELDYLRSHMEGQLEDELREEQLEHAVMCSRGVLDCVRCVGIVAYVGFLSVRDHDGQGRGSSSTSLRAVWAAEVLNLLLFVIVEVLAVQGCFWRTRKRGAAQSHRKFPPVARVLNMLEAVVLTVTAAIHIYCLTPLVFPLGQAQQAAASSSSGADYPGSWLRFFPLLWLPRVRVVLDTLLFREHSFGAVGFYSPTSSTAGSRGRRANIVSSKEPAAVGKNKSSTQLGLGSGSTRKLLTTTSSTTSPAALRRSARWLASSLSWAFGFYVGLTWMVALLLAMEYKIATTSFRVKSFYDGDRWFFRYEATAGAAPSSAASSASASQTPLVGFSADERYVSKYDEPAPLSHPQHLFLVQEKLSGWKHGKRFGSVFRAFVQLLRFSVLEDFTSLRHLFEVHAKMGWVCFLYVLVFYLGLVNVIRATVIAPFVADALANTRAGSLKAKKAREEKVAAIHEAFCGRGSKLMAAFKRRELSSVNNVGRGLRHFDRYRCGNAAVLEDGSLRLEDASDSSSSSDENKSSSSGEAYENGGRVSSLRARAPPKSTSSRMTATPTSAYEAAADACLRVKLVRKERLAASFLEARRTKRWHSTPAAKQPPAAGATPTLIVLKEPFLQFLRREKLLSFEVEELLELLVAKLVREDEDFGDDRRAHGQHPSLTRTRSSRTSISTSRQSEPRRAAKNKTASYTIFPAEAITSGTARDATSRGSGGYRSCRKDRVGGALLAAGAGARSAPEAEAPRPAYYNQYNHPRSVFPELEELFGMLYQNCDSAASGKEMNVLSKGTNIAFTRLNKIEEEMQSCARQMELMDFVCTRIGNRLKLIQKSERGGTLKLGALPGGLLPRKNRAAEK